MPVARGKNRARTSTLTIDAAPIWGRTLLTDRDLDNRQTSIDLGTTRALHRPNSVVRRP